MLRGLPKEYPRQHEGWVTIDEGREIFVRPIKDTDGPLLVDLFHKLSPRSIYLRFLSTLHELPEKWVYHFTHVDYVKDFALVAVIQERGGEAIIGVGRYACDPGTDRTELAVVVRDDWQGRGLGKALIRRVVEIAQENGISRFEALIDPNNRIIMRIIRESGYTYRIHYEEGAYRIEIEA